MHNFHANFARILEICRGFSKDLVTADSKQKNKPLNFRGLLFVVVNPQRYNKNRFGWRVFDIIILML